MLRSRYLCACSHHVPNTVLTQSAPHVLLINWPYGRQVAAIHSITRMLHQLSACDCWQSLLAQLQQDLMLPETPAEVGLDNAVSWLSNSKVYLELCCNDCCKANLALPSIARHETTSPMICVALGLHSLAAMLDTFARATGVACLGRGQFAGMDGRNNNRQRSF